MPPETRTKLINSLRTKVAEREGATIVDETSLDSTEDECVGGCARLHRRSKLHLCAAPGCACKNTIRQKLVYGAHGEQGE
jgi:hypothetical protein